jgi:putative glutamine amidotransferase
MRPIVGIPPLFSERGGEPAERDRLLLDLAYAEAVESAGGTPLLLPMQADVAVLARMIDGLLIPGGGDFLPPQAPGTHPGTHPADTIFEAVPARQLDFDRGLLAQALERGLPVLGICYGMQLLALQLGGALHYHLPLDCPDADPHQLPEPDGRHPIQVAPGTRLASLLGGSPDPVNSRHHQAVATPGQGLRVSARSPDGVIEAIESLTGSFRLGVQWHPERLPGRAREALFRAFVAACLANRRR